MDSTKLVEWLINEKNMSVRSAKDVLSRYYRVCKMLRIDRVDDFTLKKLQENEQFQASTMFVKSQLKRAVVLCLEFLGI